MHAVDNTGALLAVLQTTHHLSLSPLCVCNVYVCVCVPLEVSTPRALACSRARARFLSVSLAPHLAVLLQVPGRRMLTVSLIMSSIHTHTYLTVKLHDGPIPGQPVKGVSNTHGMVHTPHLRASGYNVAGLLLTCYGVSSVK
jgi:hypothetical protein